MMRALPISAAVLLSGCAASPGGLINDNQPFQVYESASAPSKVVQCMTQLVPGLDVASTEQAWDVSILNRQFGGVIITWHIVQKGEGSTIEARKANMVKASSFNRFAEKCF